MDKNISLAVNVGQVDAIISALETAQTDLVSEVNGIRSEISSRLSAWGEGTASRRAQQRFDSELEKSVRDLGEALAAVRQAMADVRQEAHNAEVRNVAIVTS